MKSVLPVILFVIVGIISCTQVVDKGESEKSKTLSRELTANEQELVKADRSFSYDIFRRTVGRDNSENIFISPLSISMALGMTLNGAAGDTRSAMKEAMYLQGMDLPAINESYASLIELLSSADPNVKMKLANSIWNRKGFLVSNDFIEKCEASFGARVDSLDFSEPAAVNTINQWVSDNTEGLIDTIIEGNISSETIMYLINAIYFKGDWQYQFDSDETSKKDFITSDDNLVQIDMMNQTNNLAAYVSDEVKMLDLPYGDSLFTMTLMMPGSHQTPVEEFVQNKLTADNMDEWISQLTEDTTNISVPKFNLEYEVMLNDILKTMGMEEAFDSSVANFTNINPDVPLFISQVKHKSFVEVNEEGTEAAAVTSVSMGVTSTDPQIRTLSFDRPFLFLIRERTSGTVLFMGKVSNPS